MRIALVCPYSLSAPGGVQNHVLSLATHLAMAGNTVLVMAPLDGDSPSVDGVEVVGVGRSLPFPANKSVSRLALSPAVPLRLRRFFSHFKPEVVHVHEPLQAGVSLYTLLLRERPPLVATFHAAAERMPFYDWFRPAFARLLRRIQIKAAVSPPARELLRRHFGDEVAEKIRILPNGIEVAKFAGLSKPPSSRPEIVLFVGRLEMRKGCDILLDSWPMVIDSHPSARLVVVGDGPLRATLEAKAARIRGVEMKGRLDDDELLRAYGSARVVCVPSVASESFGIVLLEGMASGACVAAAALDGYRWVGGDAVAYFPAGDSRAVAETICDLLATPMRMDELARRGRSRAARFDWERLVPDVMATYKEAAGSGQDA